ncbi:mitochondrial fission regulator 2 [Nilaparvata lugens]|uniref:mitochondrial fission regulator 2 n=1 Tax=Nilaparvata lugens TaxID=108931 RepID=UPI00193DCF51|nr:mitochondrial fission regulator 2 [Nilaparvata lugens]
METGDYHYRLLGLLRGAVEFIGQSFCYLTHPKGRSRSLVRRIGSWLPLPPAPRVYINIPSDSILFDATQYGSFYEDDYLPEMHKEQSSLCLSFAQLQGLTPQIMSSTPENHRLKIRNLEKELTDLKHQVAQILETMPTSDYGSMVSVWLGNQPLLTPSPVNTPSAPPENTHSVPSERPPTPPPLPPPPALDTTPVNLARGKLRRVARECTEMETAAQDDKKTPAAMLGDVLHQLSTERPTLRHVKRSPGGCNPEKTPKVLDPSDILSKVLRQRFQAFHPSDTDTTDNSIHNTSEFLNEVLTSPASLV